VATYAAPCFKLAHFNAAAILFNTVSILFAAIATLFYIIRHTSTAVCSPPRSVTGTDIPVQPLRTLLCYWKAKPGRVGELTAEAGFPTFGSYSDPIFYGTPSLEYPGLIKVATHGGTPCDADARDPEADDAALVEPVARWIDAVLPGHVETAGGPVRRTACMYSMTPDEDFVIDFLGGEFGKHVVVGAGFSGHGFKMAPAVGRILAEMAMDGEAGTETEAGVELGFFRIGRFVDNPKGNLKDSE
jgi:sarcosine oxidase / L-pipecolate oxidase